MPPTAVQLAVIGDAACDERRERLAFATGQQIARAGAVLLCGGGGGVMAAAAAGARSAGGLTVGILPGRKPCGPPENPHLDASVFTGMGQARNQILVLSAAAVIGVGGGWGTLSEIALALKQGIPVVLLEGWQLDRPDGADEPLLQNASGPEEAVRLALRASGREKERSG